MQMISVVMGLATVAMVAALECDRLHIIKVKAQWGSAYNDFDRTVVGRHIFENFFTRHPESRELFNKVGGQYTNSPQFKAQCLRILGGLDNLICNLDNAPVFDSLASHLAEQHSAREGVKPNYFDDIREDISDVIRDEIPDFDEEAFAACYSRISEGLKGNARYYRRRY